MPTTTILTVANQKGGVGKTTTAATLAHALAARRGSALLVDLDPQGQVAVSLGLPQSPGIFDWLVARRPPRLAMVPSGRPGLALIPGDNQTAEAQVLLQLRAAPANELLNALRSVLYNGSAPRFVIFDTSPSVGGLQERALYAADLVIIPASTSYLAADAVAATMRTLDENRRKGWKGRLLGILPTFYDERNNDDRKVLADLQDAYPDQCLSPIHRAVILAEAAAAGQTIWEYAGHSRAAQEYARLLYTVLEAAR